MNITRDNYELYFFQYLEGGLSEEERRQVERFSDQSPDLGKEMSLYTQSPRLTPTEEVCPNKSDLTHKVVSLSWLRYAAVLLCAVVAGVWYFQSTHKPVTGNASPVVARVRQPQPPSPAATSDTGRAQTPRVSMPKPLAGQGAVAVEDRVVAENTMPVTEGNSPDDIEDILPAEETLMAEFSLPETDTTRYVVPIIETPVAPEPHTDSTLASVPNPTRRTHLDQISDIMHISLAMTGWLARKGAAIRDRIGDIETIYNSIL